MVRIKEIQDLKKVEELRGAYIKTLGGPIDGYWENIVIGSSKCYEIEYEGACVGHCSINDNKRLLQLHIYKEYRQESGNIMKGLIEGDMVLKASVSTKEPLFMSLCLDFQKGLEVDTLLFTDTGEINEPKEKLSDECFRPATLEDIGIIKKECDGAFDGYYEDLIENDQLYVLYDGECFLGIGEFRIIRSNGSYGDIGVIVSEKHRGKGIGTLIITRLREECHRNGLLALSCCDVNNKASRRTMEKSGMVAEHRIVFIDF